MPYMQTSNRIKGKKLYLTLGAATVYADVKNLELKSDDPDGPTFGDSMNGVAAWTLSGTAIQSFDAASMWSYAWDHAGETVAFAMGLFGNDVPTAAQPLYRGILTIGRKPSLGGEIGSSGYEFEFEWKLEGEPVKDTGVYPAWMASTAYTLGARVKVGAAVLEATIAGTSGATSPTPPATVGLTVVDGGVTWKKVS